MRSTMLLGLGALLGACARDDPGDAVRYVIAAGSGWQSCEGIQDRDLIGECVAWGAFDQALLGATDEAQSACRQLDPGPWKDECYFLVADAVGAKGEDALSLCDDTGRWWQQCVAHAIKRDAKALFRTTAVGQEAALQAGLVVIIEGYIDGGEVTERARRMTIAHIAARLPGEPFSLTICGTADPDICRDAYLERVWLQSESSGRPWRAACGRFVTAERARAAGMPVWAPDADALVQEAWRYQCER